MTDALKAAVREALECSGIEASYGAFLNFTSALAQRGVVVVEHGNRHHDDVCVDQFAKEMKAKLAQKRKEGRYVWHAANPEVLGRMLVDHLEKGDMIDIANFAMFIWHVCQYEKFPLSTNTAEQAPPNSTWLREGGISAAGESPAPKPARKVVQLVVKGNQLIGLYDDGEIELIGWNDAY